MKAVFAAMIDRLGLGPEECAVKGCESRQDVAHVELKTFDPIDHDDTNTFLCSYHQQWAADRNAFAEKMYEQLRAARRDIGMEHLDAIQDLAIPQGRMRKDVLDGSVADEGLRYIPLEEMLER